jgi:hypothetical protein
MPRRLSHGADALGRPTSRIGPGDLPEVGRTRHWPARLCAQTRLGFAARWLLQQAGGPLPRHHMERGKTIALGLVIPCADRRAMALDSQRGPEWWYQWTAGLVWPQQHACSGLGFFFHAARSAWATRGSSGSPRTEREVGRYGRLSWRGQKSRRAVRFTVLPVV